MSNVFPQHVEDALQQAAQLLGDSLLELDYPNGSKDAVFAEANILVYVGHGLMSCFHPFRCYAEASHESRKRIDMVATDGTTVLAIEAKKFGNIGYGSEAIMADVERLKCFRPQLSRASGDATPRAWWDEAKERWGVILVGSHAGDPVNEAWIAKDEDSAAAALSKRVVAYRRRRPDILAREKSIMLNALAELDKMPGIRRGSFPICSGNRWDRCEDAHLLWAAFDIG
jgi:hypothetical protein